MPGRVFIEPRLNQIVCFPGAHNSRTWEKSSIFVAEAHTSRGLRSAGRRLPRKQTFPNARRPPEGGRRNRHDARCALRQQQLGDLHGVQRRALADLVGDHPHGQAVLNRVVSAQTADVRLVRAGQQTRHGIRVRGAVVHDHDARRTPRAPRARPRRSPRPANST